MDLSMYQTGQNHSSFMGENFKILSHEQIQLLPAGKGEKTKAFDFIKSYKS
jgi:hypothetical protein